MAETSLGERDDPDRESWNEQAYEQIRKGTEGCRPGYKDCDLGKIPQRAPPLGGPLLSMERSKGRGESAPLARGSEAHQREMVSEKEREVYV